jgi:hypothetical protein
MSFHFVNEDGLERHKIMFGKIDCVFTLDFTMETDDMNQAVKVIYEYKMALNN